MNNSPRMKLLTLCIGAALVQMASLPALADSGVGVDTVIGNAANPGYPGSGPVQLDPDMPVMRTPTGQMYNFPPVKEEGVAKGQVTGHVEIGGVVNSTQTKNSKRNEYTANNKNGVYLNNFGVAADSEGARYFTVNGGGVGRHDQFYDFTVGKYGDWKVKTFYNETQHVFTETWKSLYSGEGTGNLSTGLAMPSRYVNPGAYTGGATVTLPGGGTARYAGANTTGLTGCTALAPCWLYNGTLYGNAAAIAAIDGVTGTPNPTTGAIAAVSGTGATGAVQSNMAAAIAAKLAATPYGELALVRRKGGVRGDITLTDNLKGYASYGLEDRKGARPFAMNDGNNISTDIAEPIQYKTHDILAGLSYSEGLTQANLRASASMFRNSIKQLNVQFPLLGVATSNGVIQHGTFVLPPDNDAFNLKGEFARSLPDLMKGRFTAAASYGSNRQNDALVAPISAAMNADLAAAGVTTLAGNNPGYAVNSGLVSNWNTTDALSRKNAGQRIDNKLVDLGLSLKPVEDLSVKGSYRFFETDNKGGYIAYNPLTGQFGRGPSTANAVGNLDVVAAPSGAGCYTLPGYPTTGCASNIPVTGVAGSATIVNGANVPVFGQARSTRQYNYGISADYDLDKFSSVNLALEREDFHRNFRERAKTEENKVKLGYVNRALGDTTLRASYEQDTKRGSDYRYRTFEDLGTGLPGLDPASLIANTNPATGAGLTNVNGVVYPALAANVFNRYSYYFRKYDLANRDQKILNTRVNYQVGEDLDLGLNLQIKRADFPEGTYGLKKDNQDSVGVDMNYQPAYDTIVTSFYNFQRGKKLQTMNVGNISAIAAPACTANLIAQYGYAGCSDTTTGLDGARSIYDTWRSETTDTNHVLGLGLQNDLGWARLGVDYTYARSTTHIAYQYGALAFSATAAANQAMQALAGTALPDMTTQQNTITVNLVKPLDKKTTVRAMYRFDGMRIKDWHYDNVIMNKMAAYDGLGAGGTLLLDSGPLNYHVNTFGVFLNYKL